MDASMIRHRPTRAIRRDPGLPPIRNAEGEPGGTPQSSGAIMPRRSVRRSSNLRSVTARASRKPVNKGITLWLAVLTVVLAACGAGIPSEERHPDVIGVVQSIEPLGGTEHVYRLESGEQITLDSNDVDAIEGSAPTEFDLMLYGEDAQGAWYVGLPPQGDCFEIPGPAEFRGEFGEGRIVFDGGLSLPLADDFSPGRPSDPRVSERAHVCVNEDGEAVSYSTT